MSNPQVQGERLCAVCVHTRVRYIAVLQGTHRHRHRHARTLHYARTRATYIAVLTGTHALVCPGALPDAHAEHTWLSNERMNQPTD
jgi:hypothetical protein